MLLSASASAKGIPVRPFQQFVKPGLIESRVMDSPDTFNRLGEGFKRLFLDTSAASSQGAMAFGKHATFDGSCPPTIGCGSPKPVVIPIAGYGGHRKGEASENLFGKCFREVTIKSKIIERGGLQKHRNHFLIQRANAKNAIRTMNNSDLDAGGSLDLS